MALAAARGLAGGAPATATRPAAVAAAAAGFAVVDVWVDSGETPMAAFEVEFKVAAGEAKLVGIEGGLPGFQDPPYYDPAALARGRVVIGAFNTAGPLPKGPVRVARLHVQVGAGLAPRYEARVLVAGDRDGRAIPATASVREGELR